MAHFGGNVDSAVPRQPPLALARPVARGAPWPALAAGLVLLGALGLTWLVWQRTVAAEELARRADFEFRARDADARIEARIEAYEQVLRGAAALFTVSGVVGREQFRAFVGSLRLEEHYPGIQGLGFARLVPGDALGAHLASTRREGFEGYLVRPDGVRPEYAPAVLIEPFSGRNLRAFGFDMLSEPLRRAAMEKARSTGQAALSAKLTLSQETDEDVQAGVLIYLPVLATGPRAAKAGGESGRRARVIGWVFMPFRMDDLMEGILGERGGDLDLRLYDGPEAMEGSLLYRSDAPSEDGALETILQVKVVDRRWTMVVRARASLGPPHVGEGALRVAVGGALLSLLLAALVWSLASSRQRALRLADALTKDLRDANETLARSEEQLHRALESSGQVVWVRDLERGRTDLGKEWPAVTGRPLEEGLDRERWLAAIHEDDRDQVRELSERSARGASPDYQVEYRVAQPGGGVRWLRETGRVDAIDTGGRPLRLLGMVMDVTLIRLLQARLAGAERLAATGTLSRGLAHELNSPLASVVANLFFAREQLAAVRTGGVAEGPVSTHLLEDVGQAVEDAAECAGKIRDIVADLRLFALGEIPTGRAAPSLEAAVRDALRVAAGFLASCRSVQVDVPAVSGLPISHPDLVQLLTQLLANAGQATGQGPNDIRVAALLGRGLLELRVSDTGTGMSEATRARAFEPFFTTKDVGKGRGLGLSVCLGIAEAAGGRLAITSQLGVGTEVTLSLPIPVSPPVEPGFTAEAVAG